MKPLVYKKRKRERNGPIVRVRMHVCLLYTSDAADE